MRDSDGMDLNELLVFVRVVQAGSIRGAAELLGMPRGSARAARDRARRLERVLAGWSPPSTPIHVVYPSTRHLSPAVRSFIDHMRERMSPPPCGVTRQLRAPREAREGSCREHPA